VADLTEDVDSIKAILWSPDNNIVLYHSRCYLTAVYLPDWQMVRIYLGQEWIRHEPKRRTTFSGAQPKTEVTEIAFPGPGKFSYRLKGETRMRTISMPL
jgi:hypothetical protein